MNIFSKIKNSIYNPEYYKEVLSKPFSYSFKYLLVFGLLFALVFSIISIIKLIPIANFISEKTPGITEYFPLELTITIKNGKTSTNVQEPYFIKSPQDPNNTQSDIENIIVIDTKNKFDLDTFYSYKTQILLTSDNIVLLNNGKISISSLSNIKDFTLNKEKLTSFINKIKPFFIFIFPTIFTIASYITGCMIILLKMAYLLLGALLIWLITKIKGLKIGYKKSYQLGLHLMTPAIIIVSILNLISSKFTFVFLFTIILILSTLLNLKKNIA